MDLILVVHLLKGSWSAKHHWSKMLPVRTGAKAEARFQHLRALPSVYDLIMLELRNEVYLVWCCFFRLTLLTFLVGVWGGSFCFGCFLLVYSRNNQFWDPFRLPLLQLWPNGKLADTLIPHQLHSHQLHSTLWPGETQVLSTNPRVPSPLRVAASPAGPAHVFKSTPDDCSPTSSQRDFPRIIYIVSLAAISSPLPTHFIRSHIAVL